LPLPNDYLPGKDLEISAVSYPLVTTRLDAKMEGCEKEIQASHSTSFFAAVLSMKWNPDLFPHKLDSTLLAIMTLYNHVAAVQGVVIPLRNVCHALVLFGKEKLCSIMKEVHKFSRSKFVYLLVVVTLLLHSCGEITVLFNGLSILTVFFPPTHPFF
jgi:hypothetical protein